MADNKQVLSSADVEDSHSVKVGEVSADLDIAATYAHHLDGENAYTRKEETRLRWKLDIRLVPLLWCMYLIHATSWGRSILTNGIVNVTLGAMDKITTSTAALYGFRADTGLTGNRYSWVGSAFYVSHCIPVSHSL